MKLTKLSFLFIVLLLPIASFSAEQPKQATDDMYIRAFLSFQNAKKCQTLTVDDLMKYSTVFVVLRKTYEMEHQIMPSAQYKLIEEVGLQKFEGSVFSKCDEKSKTFSAAIIDSSYKAILQVYKK